MPAPPPTLPKPTDARPRPDRPATTNRRGFLRAGSVLPIAVAAQPAAAPAAAADAAAAAPPALRWLLPHEAEALHAIVARLIPADALGPGAREADVAAFIDGQCAGAYGQMSRSYRAGPWREGTPQQGYQAALTPAELLRAGLAALDAHGRRSAGKPFAEWTAEAQDGLLAALEDGRVELAGVPTRLFFEQLLQLTMEGFFADPIHGGNAGKVGWRLVGYPGAAAVYLGAVTRHGEPYRVEPVSLLDLYAGTAEHDGVGHAVHRELR